MYIDCSLNCFLDRLLPLLTFGRNDDSDNDDTKTDESELSVTFCLCAFSGIDILKKNSVEQLPRESIDKMVCICNFLGKYNGELPRVGTYNDH